MTELKSCAHCGGKAKYYQAGDESFGYQPGITCINFECMANVHGNFVEIDELSREAVKIVRRWNRRPEPEQAAPVAWIPVSERLPELNERVLVYRHIGFIGNPAHHSAGKTGYIDIDCVMEIAAGMFCTDLMTTGRVTHWQPLPTAPQQSQEDGSYDRD